jgi:hypothetical protein
LGNVEIGDKIGIKYGGRELWGRDYESLVTEE